MAQITQAIIMAATKSSDKQAWEIIESLKKQVIDILWNDDRHGYNNDHLLIPWIQEEAEYAIQRLNLPADRKNYFIWKIEQIIGEYMEQT